MWFVQGEKWDGTIVRSDLFESVAMAAYSCEVMHLNHSGGGEWMAFRVLSEDGNIYSEMECD